MSQERKTLRKLKRQMSLAIYIGVSGFVFLSILVINELIGIWYFIVLSIVLSISCKIFHYDSESKFEFIFRNKESFENLILNNLDCFYNFKENSLNVNIKDFTIFNDKIIGEHIQIKLGHINEIKELWEKDEKILSLIFKGFSTDMSVSILAPEKGLITYNSSLREMHNLPNLGDVVFSLNTSPVIIKNYLTEQEIIAEDIMKEEEERIKISIRERLLEREKRKLLEKEVIEEMINGGFISQAKENRKRESIPQNVQDKVWRRDSGMCVKCGSKEKLEFDHIIPFSKGGANTYRNLQLLCEKCNRQKSNNIG